MARDQKTNAARNLATNSVFVVSREVQQSRITKVHATFLRSGFHCSCKFERSVSWQPATTDYSENACFVLFVLSTPCKNASYIEQSTGSKNFFTDKGSSFPKSLEGGFRRFWFLRLSCSEVHRVAAKHRTARSFGVLVNTPPSVTLPHLLSPYHATCAQ